MIEFKVEMGLVFWKFDQKPDLVRNVDTFREVFHVCALPFPRCLKQDTC